MKNKKQNHTQGPWHTGSGYGRRMIIATNNKPIAEMTNESRFKDAHLIAAAPDLLEALEKAYEVMKVQAVTKGCQVRMSHALELSEKAIAKARGQS